MGFENMTFNSHKDDSTKPFEVDASQLPSLEEALKKAEDLVEATTAVETISGTKPTPIEEAKHAIMEKVATLMHRSPEVYKVVTKDLDVLLDAIENNTVTPAQLEAFAARLEPEDRKPFIDLAKAMAEEEGIVNG
jgi:DNA repair photolyase